MDGRGKAVLDTVVAAALAATAVVFILRAPSALSFDARFQRQPKDLPPKLSSELTDKVSDEALPYLDKEEDKHKNGQRYIDLQPKFQYLPNYGPGGQLIVSVKLGGAEYDPIKDQAGKGKATGVLRYLVFTYALNKAKWVELSKPRWESQDLGATAAKKMTAAAAGAEKRRETETARRQAALQNAAEKAQQAADKSTAPQRRALSEPELSQ